MTPVPPAIAEALHRTIAGGGHVCVVTGAGMSAESGIPTFRGTHDSLWSRFDPMRLATAGAWRDDPALVWGWYRWRMQLVCNARPNAGHAALAGPAQRVPLSLVTQNVDDLHERAGSTVDAHVHGSLSALRCFACGRAHDGALDAYVPDRQRIEPMRCTACGDRIRPGVVWFGEALPDDAWATAVDAATRCALMLVVGTSGLVYPAAGLPALARRHGATVVEINPEPTALSAEVDHVWRATAAQALPPLLG
ncbi:NAD-dependent deacylase [Pseudoxanthomonas sp. SL93]|uniref:SIR2 family NAD-dependent protein deacylase n=1 Tax=Pseudoxanthomonas sp. SL93 TaxID=2995142 RepID=UPI00226FCB64|nr:NAD-dependent deacylase [Pseudoxanthomonas sp. SL93]WAC62522.1 NAD-dependent deacylase [Pseudoxanthomonas sp. SL93]